MSRGLPFSVVECVKNAHLSGVGSFHALHSIERATFLIDGAGDIARIWRKVKVPGHVAEVLTAVQAL